MTTNYSMLFEFKFKEGSKGEEVQQRVNAARSIPNRIKRVVKKAGEQVSKVAKPVKDKVSKFTSNHKEGLKKSAIIGGSIAGLGAVGYGVHKAMPKIKQKIDERKKAKEEHEKSLAGRTEKVKDKIHDLGKKYKKLPNGQKIAVASIPAIVLAGGAAAIYAWWKKKHKK